MESSTPEQAYILQSRRDTNNDQEDPRAVARSADGIQLKKIPFPCRRNGESRAGAFARVQHAGGRPCA